MRKYNRACKSAVMSQVILEKEPVTKHAYDDFTSTESSLILTQHDQKQLQSIQDQGEEITSESKDRVDDVLVKDLKRITARETLIKRQTLVGCNDIN